MSRSVTDKLNGNGYLSNMNQTIELLLTVAEARFVYSTNRSIDPGLAEAFQE